MLARNYNFKIEIWENQNIPDDFGGFVNSTLFVKKIWADVQTKGASYKFTQLGLNDFKQPTIFSVRGKGLEITEKNFIIFKSKRFNIKSIENVNLQSLEINILADET